MCGTVGCSQVPRPALAPSSAVQAEPPWRTDHAPLAPAWTVLEGATCLALAAGGRSPNSDATQTAHDKGVTCAPRYRVATLRTLRSRPSSLPRGRGGFRAETGARPGALAQRGSGRLRTPARPLRGGGGLCGAEKPHPDPCGARAGWGAFGSGNLSRKAGGDEVTGPGSPRGAAQAPGESCSVASELRARGGTASAMPFLLFQETVGIICPLLQAAQFSPSAPLKRSGVGGSPSSADTGKPGRGEAPVGSPDGVPLFLTPP